MATNTSRGKLFQKIKKIGNSILDGTKSSCRFPPLFLLTKTKKTLLRDELFQSLHATKTTQRLKPGLAFDLPWRYNSLRVFHPTRVKNNKNLARKTFFNRMELWFLKDFVFHVFYFASNLADRLLGRWRTGRQACLNGMAFAYTAYSPSEWIDGKVFLLFLFVPTGK